MRVFETIQTDDYARSLKNERGSFLNQHDGITELVLCEPGHSIVSARKIGIAQPVLPQVGSKSAYTVTKVSDQLIGEQEWRDQNRQTQSANQS
jgi:hypothetical protein